MHWGAVVHPAVDSRWRGPSGQTVDNLMDGRRPPTRFPTACPHLPTAALGSNATARATRQREQPKDGSRRTVSRSGEAEPREVMAGVRDHLG